MIINSIGLRNFKSYGNNMQRLSFDKSGGLILLSGINGNGKCLSPDTEIDIFINDKNIEILLLKFLENRIFPLYPNNIYNKKIMRLKKDKFFKDFNNEYLLFIEKTYEKNSVSSIKRDIKNQFKKIQNLKNLKRLTIRNEEYWLIRGWSFDETLSILKNIKHNWKKPKYSNLNVEYWLDRGYDEIESEQKISEIQKKRSSKATETKKKNPNYKSPISPFTKEYWINRGIVNEEEIKIKINSQRKNNIEYWLNKGFDEKESTIKVSEYQKQNNDKKQEKWKNIKDTYDGKKQKNTNIEYYLNKGYSITDSEILLKKRQNTFTLEKCITKYGLDKGTRIYNKRQKDWIKKMFNKDTCMATGRSMLCDKFIEELIISINNKNITDNFLYGNNEKFIYDNLEKKGKRYDLCYEKKIIEFNGDFWHANPKIFESEEIHKVKKIKCSEIWGQDARKISLAKIYGYEILVIWDSDYINDKDSIIKKCKEFLDI